MFSGISSADALNNALNLNVPRGQALPHHREIFRSIVKTEATKQRRASSSALFLQYLSDIPVWHMLRTDEIISYHAGAAAQQLLILPDGTFSERIIGSDILGGEFPQSVVPAWTWRIQFLLPETGSPDAWGLFGSFVTPGFDPNDYAEASVSEILAKYPDAATAFSISL